MIVALVISVLICALVPAVLFLINLRLYLPPPHPSGSALAPVSVLIPARNEATGIAEAVQSILTTRGVDFEVVVMDDGSTDGTGAIVLALAAEDPRVRLEHAPPLPAGWNGKQHACWALAQTARYPLLCFVDADVRLQPDCVARMADFLETSQSSLVSGFPRQLTGSTLEWLLLPLIHFVLLGFLPLSKMRAGTDPAFAAGCGQFILTRAGHYFSCGGHSGIKLTMHDGLRLPRLFRERGLRTDLADLTQLATCRMYRSASQVWHGLAKNATEGIASPGRIFPISLTLVLGQILPFAALVLLLISIPSLMFIASSSVNGPGDLAPSPTPTLVLTCILASCLAGWSVRAAAARRFHQDWRGALLHPVGILLLLAIQWYALARKLSGRAVSWKTRAYTQTSG